VSLANERREEVQVKGKLASHDIGPFPILEKCGTVTYKLDQPPSLAGVNDIFHVSQLKKCLKAPVDVVLPEVTLLEADLSYPEHQIKILDPKDRVMRRKAIKFFKIHWTGATTLKKKQPGKARTFFILAIQTLCYHCMEMCDCSLFLLALPLLPNLGARFLLWVRFLLSL
jgi:hypothetical protein